MSKISRSPERGTFQVNNYIKRKEEAGEEPSKDYLEFFKSFEQRRLEQESDPEWQRDNLEWDLCTTDWILEKVRNSKTYAQNLYAALCNNEFQRRDVMPILTDDRWSCSWRHAGGIISDMRQEGDYIDWYCSGIGGKTADYESIETQEEYNQRTGYVPESVVTEEIEEDLLKLGWNIIQDGEIDV